MVIDALFYQKINFLKAKKYTQHDLGSCIFSARDYEHVMLLR